MVLSRGAVLRGRHLQKMKRRWCRCCRWALHCTGSPTVDLKDLCTGLVLGPSAAASALACVCVDYMCPPPQCPAPGHIAADQRIQSAAPLSSTPLKMAAPHFLQANSQQWSPEKAWSIAHVANHQSQGPQAIGEYRVMEPGGAQRPAAAPRPAPVPPPVVDLVGAAGGQANQLQQLVVQLLTRPRLLTELLQALLESIAGSSSGSGSWQPQAPPAQTAAAGGLPLWKLPSVHSGTRPQNLHDLPDKTSCIQGGYAKQVCCPTRACKPH